MRLRVDAISGTWTVTTSDRAKSSSRSTGEPQLLLDVLLCRHDIVVQQFHLESLRALGDLTSDVAEADDPERLALQLDARPGQLGPLAGTEAVVAVDQTTSARQHQQDRVLGDRAGFGPRRPDVADGDPASRGGVDVHVVEPVARRLDEVELPRFLDGCGGNVDEGREDRVGLLERAQSRRRRRRLR